MKREFHVRFCESLRGQFLLATRLLPQLSTALECQAKLGASSRVKVPVG